MKSRYFKHVSPIRQYAPACPKILGGSSGILAVRVTRLIFAATTASLGKLLNLNFRVNKLTLRTSVRRMKQSYQPQQRSAIGRVHLRERLG